MFVLHLIGLDPVAHGKRRCLGCGRTCGAAGAALFKSFAVLQPAEHPEKPALQPDRGSSGGVMCASVQFDSTAHFLHVVRSLRNLG